MCWPANGPGSRWANPFHGFPTEAGPPQVRQRVTVAVRNACERAGIDPAGIATHTGRRSAITAMYVAGLPLDDVARHVGHASPETTARYVTDLGTRPADTARRAAALLAPAAGASGSGDLSWT